MLAGLRSPPAAATWGAAYVGLWAGFYQSLTNRGLVRVCAADVAVEEGALRFSLTDGFFMCECSAIATHTHLYAICEIAPLDNHLLFFILNAAPDMMEIAVIDGLISGVGPDNTPVASPLLLFRVDGAGREAAVDARILMPRVAQANDRIEGEARQTGDPFAAARELAPVEVLRALFPLVGSARPDGEIDHVLRIPPNRSLAAGRLAIANLPADAPLRTVPANLRRALGLDAADKIHLLHSER